MARFVLELAEQTHHPPVIRTADSHDHVLAALKAIRKGEKPPLVGAESVAHGSPLITEALRVLRDLVPQCPDIVQSTPPFGAKITKKTSFIQLKDVF